MGLSPTNVQSPTYINLNDLKESDNSPPQLACQWYPKCIHNCWKSDLSTQLRLAGNCYVHEFVLKETKTTVLSLSFWISFFCSPESYWTSFFEDAAWLVVLLQGDSCHTKQPEVGFVAETVKQKVWTMRPIKFVTFLVGSQWNIRKKKVTRPTPGKQQGNSIVFGKGNRHGHRVMCSKSRAPGILRGDTPGCHF